jgi:queuosine precursor transporter
LQSNVKPLRRPAMTTEVQAAAAEPQKSAARAIPMSLFAFAIFYGGMVCIAGVLGNKQVALGPLAVEAGIFAFLMLVVTSSAVAELHGRYIANRLVLIGFVPLLVSLALSLIVLALPASPEMAPDRLTAFETVMGGTPRIWLGGILAYGISTLLNVTIFTRLKAREGSRLLWLRAAIASVLSQIVDTLIFITIAFYGVFPIAELLLGQMLAKVVLSAVLVPPAVYLFVALGRKLDADRLD